MVFSPAPDVFIKEFCLELITQYEAELERGREVVIYREKRIIRAIVVKVKPLGHIIDMKKFEKKHIRILWTYWVHKSSK